MLLKIREDWLVAQKVIQRIPARLPKTVVYPYINKNWLLPTSASADPSPPDSKNIYKKTGLGASTDSISTLADASSDGAI